MTAMGVALSNLTPYGPPAHANRAMRGGLQTLVVVALCVAVLVTFLAHKPACSTGNRLHNKPVAKFKAMLNDTDAKSVIASAVASTVAQALVPLVLPPVEAPVATRNTSLLAVAPSQVLSCCFLC